MGVGEGETMGERKPSVASHGLAGRLGERIGSGDAGPPSVARDLSRDFPVMDFHVHVLWPEGIAEAENLRRHDRYFDLLCTSPKNALATSDEVVAYMDRAGVEASVIFGYAFADMGLCRTANDYVSESVKRYPGRLIGFGCVPPRHREAEREVLRCKEIGLSGIGELFPDGQNFEIGDPRQMAAVARTCAYLGFPLMIHVNELVGHGYPGKGGTGPEKAYRFARANPDLDIVFPHLGGGLFFYELMPEVKRELCRVYYDTAAVPLLYSPGVYDAVKSCGAVDKVLFGSDYPLLPLTRYVKHLSSSSLHDEEKRRIFYYNSRILIAKSTDVGSAE